MNKCTKCGEEKPKESFVKDRGRKSGLYAWCKDCVSKVWEERKSRAFIDGIPSTQRCNRCDTFYPLTAEYFGVCRSRRYGFQYECRECKRKRRMVAYYADPLKNHEWSRNYQHRRRTNGPYDFIKFDEVYDRDGGICGICGVSVDKSLKHPHRDSGSIDHIRPVSRGGTHTFENVQLAHLICNITKGSKML